MGLLAGVDFVGGIFGEFTSGSTSTTGIVSKVENHGDVLGTSNVAGIIGILESSCEMSEIINAGNISATGGSCGGVIGRVYYISGIKYLSIDSSSNTGTITSTYSSEYCGTAGLFGYISSYVTEITINDCINEGNITGIKYVAGFIGLYGESNNSCTSAVKILNSKNIGDVSGTTSVAGFVAYIKFVITSTEVRNLINEGDITSNSEYTAGILRTSRGATYISDCKNTGKITGTTYTAGILGSGTCIEAFNLTNEGEITGTSTVGGVIGSLSISTSTINVNTLINSGKITATTTVGGVIGSLSISTTTLEVQSFTNSGIINATGTAGGVIGSVTGVTSKEFILSDLHNTANISSTGNYVGGLIGSSSYISIDNSSTSGSVSGASYTGMVCGSFSGYSADYMVTITNITISGTLTSTSGYAGGLVGYASYFTLSDFTNEIDVTGENVGGIAGGIGYNITINNVNNNAIITGTNYAGGLFGQSLSMSTSPRTGIITINNCKNLKNVSGKTGVGGILGYVYNGSYTLKLSNLVNEGDITATESYSGGITGYIGNSIALVTLENCKNAGIISGAQYVSGLFPIAYNCDRFTEMVNEGDVSGTGYVGGLAGSLSTVSNTSIDFTNLSNSGDITSTGNYTGGLFGKCTYANILDNVGSTGNISGTGYVGRLAGSFSGMTNTYAVVSNFEVSGTITSTSDYAGGLFGVVSYISLSNYTNELSFTGSSIGGIAGQITNSILDNVHNTANLTSTNYNGGIAGYISNSVITNCTNSGSIVSTNTSSSYYTGGLFGYFYAKNIEDISLSNCINNGDVTGYQAGGIAGYVYGYLNNLVNNGNVTGSLYSAGILAIASSNSVIKNAVNNGALSSSSSLGGIVASAGKTTIINCTNNGVFTINGTTTATDYGVGGILGYSSSNIEISNCINNVDINVNSSYVGGIAGKLSGYSGSSSNTISLLNNVNNGKVSGVSYVGGIIGSLLCKILYIENPINNKDVTATGDYCGGLFGNVQVTDIENKSNISNFKNYGDISAASYVGGIAGTITAVCMIDNMFNSGDIRGVSYVGGCFGNMSVYNFINALNLGDVLGNGNYIGGIVGYIYGSTTINNTYMKDCCNYGNITGTGSSNNVAGIVGEAYYLKSGINQCCNMGDVYVDKGTAAGIVGEAMSSNIISCANYGKITCVSTSYKEAVGGINGDSPHSDMYNCVNYGEVVNGGGLSGYIYNAMVNCVNFGKTNTSQFTNKYNVTPSKSKNLFALGTTASSSYFSIVDGEFILNSALNGETNLLTILNNFVETDTSYEYLSWVRDDLRNVLKLDFGENVESFTISDVSDFVEFTSRVNAGETFEGMKVQLLTDIYLNDITNFDDWSTSAPSNLYSAIGSISNKFEGTFEGYGHTIYGLYMVGDENVGLFGRVGENGVIQNLGLANAYISGSNNIAGFTDENAGEIINCFIRDSVITGLTNVSGIVVNNSGVIKNSYANVTLIGGTKGIVISNSGTIDNCFSNLTSQYLSNTGEITHTDQFTITTIDYVTTYEVANAVYGVKDLRRILNVWCYENMHYDSYWDLVDDILVPSLSVPKDYKVNSIYYYMDGGEFNSEPYRFYLGGGVYTLSNDISREYYHFDGWYLDLELTQKITVITADMDENVILYAKWLPNEHNLIYNYNGADGNNTVTEQVVYSDKKVGEMVIPTRTGYMFKGWFSSSDFSGEEWTSEIMYLFDEDTELYAKWEANIYSITFVYYDGVDNTIQSVTYDQQVGEIPISTREGYTFKGWNDREDGAGFSYTSSTVYNVSSNITLYAIWEVA